MQSSMLEEVIDNPNPYPVIAEAHYPEIWLLCLQARELAWNPVTDIDWEELKNADLPPEVRAAGAEYSIRAMPARIAALVRCALAWHRQE